MPTTTLITLDEQILIGSGGKNKIFLRILIARGFKPIDEVSHRAQ